MTLTIGLSRNNGNGHGRVPPHNLDMEEALLGAMLLSRSAIEDGLATVAGSDFYIEKHSQVFNVLCALHHAGTPIDANTVLAELHRRDIAVDKSDLLMLQAGTPASANASHYAQEIADAATGRRLIDAAGQIGELGYDTSEDVIERVRLAKSKLEDVEALAAATTVEAPLTAEAFCGLEFDVEWIVEELIERMDRIIITGKEGGGKSTLCMQLAVLVASGLHPFRGLTIPARKVLYLDLENSPRRIQRGLNPLMRGARDHYKGDMLHVESRPQGMNLRKAADRRWLDAKCATIQPNLLVMGPHYKAYSGGGTTGMAADEAADECRAALDDLRVRYQMALIIEAHSPHGEANDRANYRPYGSSLWMRWPEFGIALKPVADGTVDIKHWRGARERDRIWPTRLIEGRTWPWEEPGMGGQEAAF